MMKTNFFFKNNSVTSKIVQSIDWTNTEMGDPSEWPIALHAALGVLFGSRHPAFLFWGPEAFSFYNDAFMPSFGPEKHPSAMGLSLIHISLSDFGKAGTISTKLRHIGMNPEITMLS